MAKKLPESKYIYRTKFESYIYDLWRDVPKKLEELNNTKHQRVSWWEITAVDERIFLVVELAVWEKKNK